MCKLIFIMCDTQHQPTTKKQKSQGLSISLFFHKYLIINYVNFKIM